MALSLGVAAVVLVALIATLALERVRRLIAEIGRLRREPSSAYDPGRELRAEHRARELLRSCVNEEEWEMYRDLGFLRVWGALSSRPREQRQPTAASDVAAGGRMRVGGVGSDVAEASDGAAAREADYAYLIYPHRPIVAYLPQTGTLLNEYCVTFPDRSAPYGSTKLPASDDVLAKWMALRADERRLISEANMHLPGRQIDPEMVRRDLRSLARWERERLRQAQRAASTPVGGQHPASSGGQRGSQPAASAGG
jgi:hypothetical protein